MLIFLFSFFHSLILQSMQDLEQIREDVKNAAYEIIFDNDMDNAITINEAVELAKIYCDARSPKFINGVLGSLSRS